MKLPYLTFGLVGLVIGWYVLDNYTLEPTSPAGAVNTVKVANEITTNSTNASTQQYPEVSDDGAGQVTMSAEVTVTPTATQIQLALNTHSVNLDSISFSDQIWIEKDGQVIRPISASTEGKNHHRGSQLAFPVVKAPFTIVGNNIAGVARRELIINVI